MDTKIVGKICITFGFLYEDLNYSHVAFFTGMPLYLFAVKHTTECEVDLWKHKTHEACVEAENTTHRTYSTQKRANALTHTTFLE